MKKREYDHNGMIYEPKDIGKVLELSVNDENLRGNVKGSYFFDIPVSFDIETTSFYKDENKNQYDYAQVREIREKTEKVVKFEKLNIMYIWQLGINGNIIIGRTWQEFKTVIDYISKHLELDGKRRLLIYVHNLSYEFQFIRNLFKWDKVFSIDTRKPIYARTTNFIEFRCSYLLSGYSLSNLSKQLVRNKISKKTGDLDYSLIRHNKTELTEEELTYCIDDVKIVMLYILELIENNGGIFNLPLTKTGFVRKYCKEQCLYEKDLDGKKIRNWHYIELMDELQIQSLKEFNLLNRAFSGGFTHANAYYTDSIVKDVASFDFNSSYPYVMIAEQFPMSRGIKVPIKTMKQFKGVLDKYCCVFDIAIYGLRSKQTQDNPLSVSKCFKKSNVLDNNGRIVSAEYVMTTITNVDYKIFEKFYVWDNIKVEYVMCYKKGYLPTEFIKAILSLYGKKTTLKGVEGSEQEYMLSKEMLNSCYGMCVTNPMRDEFTYYDEWDIQIKTDEEKEELLYKHNTTKNRFLFYAWGIFVTAYARSNLFTAIDHLNQDYVYSDTDSVKFRNLEKHKKYFEEYNDNVIDKLLEACNYHEIDYDLCRPKTIKGESKLLGVWDFEGLYSRFKTLGAKRYMIEEPNALTVNGTTYNYSLTVSGVNKFSAIPYLYNKYKDNIFDAFTNYLNLPPEATSKNIHTYIDYYAEGEIIDYKGNKSNYTENNSIHLEPTGYSLSLSILYLQHLHNINFNE